MGAPCWDSGLVTGPCGVLEQQPSPVVSLSAKVMAKVGALALTQSQEWLLYLIGKRRRDGIWAITDAYLPPQTVGPAHVDVAPDAALPKGVVGTIHSHVNMGTFHSTTDRDHLHANHDVNLVYSNGDISAVVRTEAPCKQLQATVPAVIEVDALDMDLTNLNKVVPAAAAVPWYTAPKYQGQFDIDSSPYRAQGQRPDGGFGDL